MGVIWLVLAMLLSNILTDFSFCNKKHPGQTAHEFVPFSGPIKKKCRNQHPEQ
jgi:hypothetical protein